MRKRHPELRNLEALAADLNGPRVSPRRRRGGPKRSAVGAGPEAEAGRLVDESARAPAEALVRLLQLGIKQEPLRALDEMRRAKLRELVKTWIAVDRNTAHWKGENPTLARDFELAIWNGRRRLMPLIPSPQVAGSQGGRVPRVSAPPRLRVERTVPGWTYDPPPGAPAVSDDEARALFDAANRFADLLLDENRDKLRKCDRPNCDRFFVRTDRRQWYCEGCPADRRVAKFYARERRKKLAESRQLRRAWRTAGKPGDWKEWVAERSKTGLTRKFLTQAANRAKRGGPRLSR